MSCTEKRRVDHNRLINSGLLVCLLIYTTIVTLLLFRNFFFDKLTPECVKVDSNEVSAPPRGQNRDVPYLGNSKEDFVALLNIHTRVPPCVEMKEVSLSKIKNVSVTEAGMEDAHICMDTIPAHPTASNCRIYSIDPSPDNVLFELKMGMSGCRVHIITKITALNYGRISNNTYLYPLHISPDPGQSHYSLDNYINLMSHETKLIHLVKTTIEGSEWRLLSSLYASETQAWRQILQLRLVIHVPTLTPETRDLFSLAYLLLRDIPTLGYKLVYSEPIVLEGQNKTEPNALPDRYETIWMRK